LLAVRRRLLGDHSALDAGRAQALLNDDLGIDRLESFGAKFSRMQDTLIDKLVPALLHAAGEPVLAAIDNLDRMERLGLIAAAESWLEMRRCATGWYTNISSGRKILRWPWRGRAGLRMSCTMIMSEYATMPANIWGWRRREWAQRFHHSAGAGGF